MSVRATDSPPEPTGAAMGQAAAPLGVYVHFPWCRRRCSYCDFAIAVARDDGGIPHEPWREAIAAELARRAEEFAGRRLVSIYFGGGTPSLWRPESVAHVIDDVCARFGQPGASRAALEITLEANPTDCTRERMAAWLDAGINRLSIGVQSFEAGALVTLGRDHRMGDGRAALERALGLLAGRFAGAADADAGAAEAAAAAEAATRGFRSLSADVILGVPGTRGAANARSVRAAISATDADAADAGALQAAALGVPHLSVYELTIEPDTPLGRAARAGRFTPADEDALAETYAATHEALRARGYEHYEVSSYALPGHRAVHNALYWSGGEYLGLGNAAASFRRLPDGSALRSTNTRSAMHYLRGVKDKNYEFMTETLTSEQVRADALWLGMRTTAGVAADALPAADADWLVSRGLARPVGDRIIPTLKGFLYADRVAERLFQG